MEALRGDLTIAEPAVKYELHPTLATKWKKQSVGGLADVCATALKDKTRTKGGNQMAIVSKIIIVGIILAGLVGCATEGEGGGVQSAKIV